MNRTFTRRRMLQALCGLPLAMRLAHGRDAVPRRIVSMSWELTETLLLLGHVPVGLSLPDWYNSTIVEPRLPDGVVDTGLLYQPNFQVLLELAPDLLLLTPGHAPLLPALARLAPPLTLGAYIGAADPYPALLQDTRAMAAALAEQRRAEQLIDDSEHLFATTRQRLERPRRPRAVLVADLLDEHHVRLYGPGSLFDALLGKIGVDNAASRYDGLTGSAVLPLQRLAEVDDCALLLSPLAPRLSAALRDNRVWQALPVVRQGRVAQLPVIAPYGGLRSLQRFAHAVEHALLILADQETAGA